MKLKAIHLKNYLQTNPSRISLFPLTQNTIICVLSESEGEKLFFPSKKQVSHSIQRKSATTSTASHRFVPFLFGVRIFFIFICIITSNFLHINIVFFPLGWGGGCSFYVLVYINIYVYIFTWNKNFIKNVYKLFCLCMCVFVINRLNVCWFLVLDLVWLFSLFVCFLFRL